MKEGGTKKVYHSLPLEMGNNLSEDTARCCGEEIRPITLLQEHSYATVAELLNGLSKTKSSGALDWERQQQLQHKPIQRTSSERDYRPRTKSLRKIKSCLSFERFKANSKPPTKTTLKKEEENKRLQEETALLEACTRGDLCEVVKLVDSGVDVNSTDRNQMTALHFAAKHARDEVIKFLICRGAEVNTADLNGGFSAIHWVIINAIPKYSSTDHLEVCLTALTKAGCRVNATDFNYATPLHIAAQKGNADAVQVLLRLGADPNKVDITGRNCFEVTKNEQVNNHMNTLVSMSSKVLESPPPSFPALSPPLLPPVLPPNHVPSSGDAMYLQERNSATRAELVNTLSKRKSSDTQLDCEQLQHKLIHKTSLPHGYRPQTGSLRKIRSCLLLGSSNAKSKLPAKTTLKMGAESKLQEENALLAACARGDLKKVEKLVDSGVNVNSSDKNRMTALHFAAMHKRAEVIKFLISKGAEVNTADLKGGFLAIHWAIINTNPNSSTDHLESCLIALTKAGCRVNATDFNFSTPLHIAAQKGNMEEIQVLLRLGADPNKIDIRGRNPFEVAKNEQIKTYMKTLLDLFPKKNDLQHIYHVLESPPPSSPAPSLPIFLSPTPTSEAVHLFQQQSSAINTELTIRKNSFLSKGKSSAPQMDFEWQQQLQHKPIERTISQHGYRPQTGGLRKIRSCHLLGNSTANNKAPVKISLKMGAEIKLQEKNALLAACAQGNLSIVEKLVDSGVDVNSSDRNQRTALHIAAMHSRDDVIKFLISRGAEVNTADLKGGFSALHWVVINAIPNISTNHLKNCLVVLTKAGCRVNTTDFNHSTPLHIAAQKGNRDAVQVLLRLGANPNKVDITGRNCFEVAKDEQVKNYMKTLLDLSAKKNDQRHTYHILESPPPSFPAPLPPVLPPSPLHSGKSDQDEHIYHTPKFNFPPSSPSGLRPTSVTSSPRPPLHRNCQYVNDMDSHLYHVLEPTPSRKSKVSRAPGHPRRRKAFKN